MYSENKKMSNIRCNICLSEKSFVKNEVKDLICSDCFSTSDERLLYENIKDYINEDLSVIYFDARESLHNKIKNITSNYQSYSDKKDNNNTLIKNLSFLDDVKTDSVDLILFTHVLDKCEDVEEALSNFSRILKQNGKLIMKENVDFELESKIEEDFLNTPKLRRMFLGNSDAHRCFGQDLLESLEQHGFKVEYSSPEKQKYNIQKSSELIPDPLLICTKV